LSAPLRFTWARVPSYATKLSDSTPYWWCRAVGLVT
jgi:hypothetical protein